MLNLAGSVAFTGHLSQLGAYTLSGPFQLTGTAPPPLFAYDLSGTATIAAANGDELFGDVTGTGTANTDTGQVQGTNLITITGGTGRFVDANGALTATYTGTGSVTGTDFTGPQTQTIQGQISY